MKINKLIPFLLTGLFLGSTIPSYGMQQLTKLMRRPITLGALTSLGLYSSTHRELERQENTAAAMHELENILVSERLLYLENAAHMKMTSSFHKHLQEIKNKAALDKQLQNFARTHHNLENVQFTARPVDNEHAYGADTIRKNILIPISDYNSLLSQVSQNHDKDIFADPKNARIAASLHHECGHIVHKSIQTKEKLDTLSPALMGGLLEVTVAKKPLTQLIAPRSLIIAGTCYALSRCITNAMILAFGKYDEVRADDIIPNEPQLLLAQEQVFRRILETETAVLNHLSASPEAAKKLLENLRNNASEEQKKAFDNRIKELGGIDEAALKFIQYLSYINRLKPLTQLFTDEHPSHEFRAERFKARRLALEQKSNR